MAACEIVPNTVFTQGNYIARWIEVAIGFRLVAWILTDMQNGC